MTTTLEKFEFCTGVNCKVGGNFPKTMTINGKDEVFYKKDSFDGEMKLMLFGSNGIKENVFAIKINGKTIYAEVIEANIDVCDNDDSRLYVFFGIESYGVDEEDALRNLIIALETAEILPVDFMDMETGNIYTANVISNEFSNNFW